jgi:hypothetical protein
MLTQLPEALGPGPIETDAERIRIRIGGQVLLALGRPGDLRAVEVRPLWERHYRVNVLVGGHAASVTVAHSYFLEANGAGDIVEATPEILRKY